MVNNHPLPPPPPPLPADYPVPGNIVAGKYRYMSDLQALEATASGSGPNCFCPSTPLVQQAWRHALEQHPDRDFVQYLLTGMQCGFHVGARRSSVMSSSAQGNLPSVRQHPQLVAEHLATEREAGRLLGPLPSHLAELCQVSPIGLIPKPHQPGKWRLIVDLSSPHGASVNDAISVDYCHMRYASVLDAAAIIRQLGKGTVLAKIDLLSAYRIIPVHPDDHPLLAIKWDGDTFIDTALPFGLRSAPKIFPLWRTHWPGSCGQWGVKWQLHYLDDYLFCGPRAVRHAQTPWCWHWRHVKSWVCQWQCTKLRAQPHN